MFRIGVFEDFNRIADPSAFERMLLDVRSRGFDSVLLTNGWAAGHDVVLAVADRLAFDVYLGPMGELNAQWWDAAHVPATIEAARAVIYPLVDQLKDHHSLKGYYIADEPDAYQAEKMRLAIQAFSERDPARPAFPVLVGLDRVQHLVRVARPPVIVIDIYPAALENAPCDFTLRAFGYSQHDFVSYTRVVTAGRPHDVPLWFVLQTHGNIAGLREPTVEEVRLQAWLAIGEGARGIYWFIYSSQQGWRGLVDNPALYGEVTSLAQRFNTLRPLLSRLHKVEDRFTVTGTAYVSTLAHGLDTRLYAVVANRLCQPQTVMVRTGRPGLFRDVESGQGHMAGSPLDLAPGEGRLLEWLPY